jgi:hypothetical protein
VQVRSAIVLISSPLLLWPVLRAGP